MSLSWKRLQWLRTKRFVKQNKGPFGALLSGLLALCLFWAFRGSKPAMDWFITWVADPWKRFFGAVAEPLPFSMAELLCTVLGVWVLVLTVGTVRRQLAGYGGLGRRLVSLAALGMWIYAGVCGFWGVHYYGTGFGEKSGLVAEPITTSQLAATTLWFAQGANHAGEAVQRNAQNQFEGDSASIMARGPQSFDGLLAEYPFLQGPKRSPKPAAYSWFMSAAGFTGYIFPFLGETTLNLHCPNVYLPVTIAHELAHQRGVAPEQEANFLGVAACLANPDPEYAYSGWLFGYAQLSSALYPVDQEAWQQAWDSLSEGCKADLEQNNNYWAAFESPVMTLMQNNYSGFLQGYGQTLGIASYGACVDLLVARYCPAE